MERDAHSIDASPRDLAASEPISAVFLIAFQGENVLSVLNERGWDIPGGHVEPGETPLDALRREVLEEACASFGRAEPCSYLTVPDRRDIMQVFAAGDLQLLPFTSSADAIGRDVLPVEVLLDRYYGPKDILRQLVSSARSVMRNAEHGGSAYQLRP